MWDVVQDARKFPMWWFQSSETRETKHMPCSSVLPSRRSAFHINYYRCLCKNCNAGKFVNILRMHSLNGVLLPAPLTATIIRSSRAHQVTELLHEFHHFKLFCLRWSLYFPNFRRVMGHEGPLCLGPPWSLNVNVCTTCHDNPSNNCIHFSLGRSTGRLHCKQHVWWPFKVFHLISKSIFLQLLPRTCLWKVRRRPSVVSGTLKENFEKTWQYTGETFVLMCIQIPSRFHRSPQACLKW